jgi:hypothetical protein
MQLPEMEDIINREPSTFVGSYTPLTPAPQPFPPDPPVPTQPAPQPVPNQLHLENIQVEEEDEEDMTEDEIRILLKINLAYDRNHTDMADIFDELTRNIDDHIHDHQPQHYRITTLEEINMEDERNELLEQIQTVIDSAKELRQKIRNT